MSSRDQAFYTLMQRFLAEYEALLLEYGDTHLARHFVFATRNLFNAQEIMEIECGMDGK